MIGTPLKVCNAYARIWKNSGANGTLLETHAKTAAKPDLFGYALFVKLKQNDTMGSENMKADTIWQVCIECSKRYYYDRRIKRCATCSRERKEAIAQKKRNVTAGGVRK